MLKHFNTIFTNPPYNGNLDIKLIKNLIQSNITDKIICVHPGGWLFNKAGSKKDKYEELKVLGKLEEVTFFWGNEMFDNTVVGHAHCISVWNMKKNDMNVHIVDNAVPFDRKDVYGNINKYEYDANVNEINIHSKFIKETNEFYNKFIDCDNILNHIVNVYDENNKTDFGVKFPSMRNGLDIINRDYGHFFSLFGNTEKTLAEVRVGKNVKLAKYYMTHPGYHKYYPLWYFKNEEERTNFIDYCKLKCVRFLLSLVKCNNETDTCRPARIIPWMDFTKHYSEEDLKKAWNIDGKLWDYIDKFFPDYYEDYKDISK